MHVLRAMEPLLQQLVTRLLPKVAHEALGAVVSDTLMPMVADLGDTPVHLVLNPAARVAVETHLTLPAGLPLIIEEEPSLAEGQVYLRLGPAEAKVDLDRAIARITQAVRGFFDLAGEPQPPAQAKVSGKS